MAPGTVDQRLRVVALQAKQVRPRLAADLKEVAEALGGDQRDLPPRRWIRALIATVVPWQIRSMASGSMEASAHSSCMPRTMADAGFSGVDGRLWTRTVPLAPSSAKKSVNVPPTSTPMSHTLLISLVSENHIRTYWW
jgi:hypothetical protein